MKASFLMALGPAPLSYFNGTSREPYALFDSALLSYAYWKRGLERPAFSDNTFVVGDSGGFSVAASDARLDAKKVIQWQIRNTNLGYILDHPPYEKSPRSGVAEFAPDLWDDCLEGVLPR